MFGNYCVAGIIVILTSNYDFDLIKPFFEEGHEGFCLETHLHTADSSACGCVNARDMVRMYKKAGYDGVIVTDHFLTGNTCVSRELPWKKQVERFFQGFEEAYDEGQKIGLRVFEGLEYSNFGTDFIVLGLDRQWICDNQEMIYMTPDEFLPMFKNAGATIIQAHPYREADYIRTVRPYPHLVDAIEVVNLGNRDDEWNKKAYKLAQMMDKPMTGGSDCHRFGNDYFGAGIRIDHEPKDLAELCEIIKSGKGFHFIGGSSEVR